MKISARVSIAASVLLAVAACSKPAAPEPSVEGGAPTTLATPAADVASSTVPEPTPAPASASTTSNAAPVEQSLATVYFEFDSSTLSGSTRSQLDKLAESLKADTSAKVRIEGNCDERGSNEYNLALGEQRARSVQDYLVAAGVSGSVLSTISYGEERPAVVGHTEAAFSKNRRAEFKKL